MSTYTQREVGGLVELTESTLAELKSSKYYNDDLAPSSISERSWTTYSITMLWVGMAICIPSLALASGLIGMGVSPWLSVLNVALGNIIILIPIQLNSQIGTKYGIPFPLFARMTFGTIGSSSTCDTEGYHSLRMDISSGMGRRRRCRRYDRMLCLLSSLIRTGLSISLHGAVCRKQAQASSGDM